MLIIFNILDFTHYSRCHFENHCILFFHYSFKTDWVLTIGSNDRWTDPHKTACKCLDFYFCLCPKVLMTQTADADPKSDEKLYLNSSKKLAKLNMIWGYLPSLGKVSPTGHEVWKMYIFTHNFWNVSQKIINCKNKH